ncbi:MAG: MarR family transcriptional regulator [Tepidisphaeraceae bacterium]|jgi:MarR family transcriptional regulator, lower aerobic nicotinate degradation pathway regulator
MGAHTSDPAIRAVLDCIRRIVRALRLFDREAEKRFGLSGAQVFVLQRLGDSKAISINELASRTHTHQSSVSVVVSKLVDRRLVRRSSSPKDARRVELSLTQRGRRLLRSAPPSAQDRLIASLAALSRIRRRRLGDLLTELIRKTGIEREPPALFFEDHAPRRRRARAKT